MKRKKIERSLYAERKYNYYIQTRKYIKAIYYYIKWKYYEWRI